MKRVLGIDCGSSATGYGLIDSDGRRSTMVAAGVIRSRPQRPFPERLLHISQSLRELIQEYSPAVVAVEGVFHVHRIIRWYARSDERARARNDRPRGAAGAGRFTAPLYKTA